MVQELVEIVYHRPQQFKCSVTIWTLKQFWLKKLKKCRDCTEQSLETKPMSSSSQFELLTTL